MSGRSIRVASGVLVAAASIAFLAIAASALLAGPADSRPRVVDRDDEVRENIVVNGQPIEIAGRVRGNVLALGGDVTISGIVEGDVAAVGGSVRQSEGSHVSGDVIVVGGEYTVPGTECRDAHRDTVLLAGSEQSLREFFANPTRQLLMPKMDRTFFGWRIAAALSSFVLAIMLVAIAPSSISRASERLAGDPLKIAAIGLVGTLAGIMLVSLALVALPSPLSAVVSGLVLVALVVVQLFGRVVAYFLVGRWMQRRMFGPNSRSQTVALLVGVLALAFVGSLPIVGALLVFATFIVSMGLILTMPSLGRA